MSTELDGNENDDIQDMMSILDSLPNDNDGEIDYNVLFESIGLDIKELEKEMEEYIPRIDLEYRKSDEDSIDPQYAYKTDSGFDLYSTEEVMIDPLGRKLVPTGIHINIPDGYEIQVRSKSGLALKEGLMVLNSPGTVDQGYTGEIQVILFNTTNQKVKIKKSQKIAQAVLCPVVSGKWVNLVQRESIGSKDRNNNGFGSTGI
jgi:dUTP pyrophosphatase